MKTTRIISEWTINLYSAVYLIPLTYILIKANILDYSERKLVPETIQEFEEVEAYKIKVNVGNLTFSALDLDCQHNNKLKILAITSASALWPELWIWRFCIAYASTFMIQVFPALIVFEDKDEDFDARMFSYQKKCRCRRTIILGLFYFREVCLYLIGFCLDLPRPVFHYLKTIDDQNTQIPWILHVFSAFMLLTNQMLICYLTNYKFYFTSLFLSGFLAIFFFGVVGFTCWNYTFSLFCIFEYTSVYLVIFFTRRYLLDQLAAYQDMRARRKDRRLRMNEFDYETRTLISNTTDTLKSNRSVL